MSKVTTRIIDPDAPRPMKLGVVHAHDSADATDNGYRDEDGDLVQVQLQADTGSFSAPLVLVLDLSLNRDTAKRLLGKVMADFDAFWDWFERGRPYVERTSTGELVRRGRRAPMREEAQDSA